MTSIATLGSHCALQLLKGAKDEGFKTLLICEKKREKLYKRFRFIDELILVDSFLEVIEQKCEDWSILSNVEHWWNLDRSSYSPNNHKKVKDSSGV